MIATTKQRYISTSIWSDDWFDSLSEREKLVYFYLLTNEHTNPAGVYQCTLKNVRLEIGLDRDEIERIMEKFATDGKAFYFKDYIIIPKWLKHQKIKERSGLYLGAAKVLKSLPDDIKAFISNRRHYDWDISDIIGGGSIDPLETLPPENGDPPLKRGRPSGEHPPQNTPKQAHDSDLDSDSDLDIDIDIDGDTKQGTTQCAKPVEKPPTTTTVNYYILVKDRVKQHGFYVDDQVVTKIIASITNTDWLTHQYSIIDFAAEKINDAYEDKPKEERKKLFVSALTKWDNIRDEYPDWRIKKIKADEKRALEKLRNTPPRLCPYCNTDFEGVRICPQCNGSVDFNEDKKEWVYVEPFDFPSLSETFRKQCKEKATKETGTETQVLDDIDF